MRLTAIFNAVNRRVYRNRKKDGHNQIKLAKFLWHHGSKRKVLSTGEKDLLTSKGFKVWSPDEFISKPYETPKYEDYFPPPIKEEKPRLEPLYRLDSDFLPLLSKCTDLMQHLSWSVIVDSLPASITERQRQLTTAERRLIEECILSSHLLDGVMDPLPLTENYELPNRIEKPRRVDMPHGIPVARKNMLLTVHFL
ncbi:uncharacterized protein LOC108666018 [Hyalella azteca]|uniref:Uncharacterized protein LOC108666018 n=1 Tax=Hyalella azteca TaxID=294128 RepID=A0A8B7N383_HYAAZ|nr:uncharacterized protein LOC108666018 [Hyalella azteca]